VAKRREDDVGINGRCLTALPVLLALASPALAQTPPAPLPGQPAAERTVDFSADSVAYDSDHELVTAEGRVRMSSEGNYLAADKVVWNRTTGIVTADGNVVVLTPEGNRLVSEHVELTDTLREGVVSNLLVVLDTGGRIAARQAKRTGNFTELEDAVYSACPVVSPTGCPQTPSWSISAARLTRDETSGRMRFQGARFHILGLSFPILPIFWIGSTREKGSSGLMTPDLSYSHSNGLEIRLPYYFRFSPSRDLTVTPRVYTGSAPGLEARYRELNSLGAFQVGGFVSYSKIDDPSPDADLLTQTSRRGIRAYGELNGRYQFTPEWSLTTSLRAATDKTVTRRYDLTGDDRLRSTIDLERINPNSYISLAGWYFQGLRTDDHQRELPFALPALDARFRLPDPVAGGMIQLQLNSLAIGRFEGQDTQRAFASARWDMRRILPWGQELTLTAYGRGDIYHTTDAEDTTVDIYRGTDGWHSRLIGALAADLRWPLVGPALGGMQRLTPRIQLVLTPPTPNLDIPNEDARAVDLEDSNLFALNRFPGYDRWEDGSRVTYGVEWNLDRPNWSVNTVVGQSYRLTRDPTLFPDGTGLTDRLSDIVGRTRIRFGSLVDVTHRYRLDKDNLAVRRNEVDLTVGGSETYIQAGYLRLDRNIDPTLEDLRDKEELRLAGRLHFAHYWSIFGATVINLTDQKEDPGSLSDGFQAVRDRLGIQYEDDCLDLGLSWKRDYEVIGAFRKGSTFSLHFSLKGLGR
jgi:LPS-assembly protein